MTSASHDIELLALFIRIKYHKRRTHFVVGPQFNSARAHKVIACKYHRTRSMENVHPQKPHPVRHKYSIPVAIHTLPSGSCGWTTNRGPTRCTFVDYNGKCYNNLRRKQSTHTNYVQPKANMQLKANNIHFADWRLAHETNISISSAQRCLATLRVLYIYIYSKRSPYEAQALSAARARLVPPR